MSAPTDYAVTTATREGAPVMTIAATITDSAGWLAFVATINAQADALGFIPEIAAEEPDEAPRQRAQQSGPPRPGTFDAEVLAFGSANGWPDTAAVAEHFGRKPLVARSAIGRLKARGVWPA